MKGGEESPHPRWAASPKHLTEPVPPAWGICSEWPVWQIKTRWGAKEERASDIPLIHRTWVKETEGAPSLDVVPLDNI